MRGDTYLDCMPIRFGDMGSYGSCFPFALSVAEFCPCPLAVAFPLPLPLARIGAERRLRLPVIGFQQSLITMLPLSTNWSLAKLN